MWRHRSTTGVSRSDQWVLNDDRTWDGSDAAGEALVAHRVVDHLAEMLASKDISTQHPVKMSVNYHNLYQTIEHT